MTGLTESHVEADRNNGANQQQPQHEILQSAEEELAERSSFVGIGLVRPERHFSFREIDGRQTSVQA